MGRPQGELRGRTAQANALAQWLRTVIGHVPVRDLEAALYVGKSSWGAYRNGSTLITEKLLTEVVDRYVADSAMRERQRAEGLRLLAEAETAGRTLKEGGGQAPLMVRQRPREPLALALLRLDDARLLQMEAMRKLADSEKQCTLLGSTVKVLQDRCLVLEQERDSAREDRARLQRELDLSLEYRRQAGEQLEHARQARSAAERLTLTADERVTRERMAVERQAAGAAPAEEPEDARRDASGEALGLPPLDQIEAVLRASRAQLEEQDEELDDLRGRMGDEPAEGAPQSQPPIVRSSLLDNETAGRRGVVRPDPVDIAEESEDDFGVYDAPPAWYTQAQTAGAPTDPAPVRGAPTVGPGHLAILRYRTGDGTVHQITRTSAPGRPHPEWQLLYELRARGVPPNQVLDVRTELEACDLPGGYCARMIQETWPRAVALRDIPYGGDLASRRAGMWELLTRRDADQAPVRTPLLRAPAEPQGSGVASAAHHVARAFAPENVVRFTWLDALRTGAPAVVQETLVEAGLPRDFGPFFWALPEPDQPWATSSDVALLCNALVASGADISLVVGHDFGRALCVERKSLRVVAVPLDSPGTVTTQFVNSGLPDFAHCLALLGRMWPLRHGLTPQRAGRWTEEFQSELMRLDPPALAGSESWWSLLLEQMWDGLL
ncbi:SUKH-4 family immunity protein [Streptomyces sp. NBC_01264]|uniref:SUKH-4 family immunity protein n=1 Tax=Streptomyces sp. NBC_01264 TaxID=2903804 RepID=UPI002257E80D|nr:SUKH-4 family immunity protein [Streptomyces sp. NBC_01264]MCX4781370.1 SUKH-4 family immunity protein [Streptomyces sp. NBC_01264]